jgi:predicted nucleic acid-binding protein
MILLDTMVVVYARQSNSPFHDWAIERISEAVITEGASISAVSLAQLCAEEGVDSADVLRALNGFGIDVIDVSAKAAGACGEAYRAYRRKRKSRSGKDSPKIPLPDFFIGAQAQANGWTLVTNDPQRFRSYFPKIRLVTPQP